MAAPALKLEAAATGGMDRRIPHGRWSPTRWPIALRVVIAVAGAILLIYWSQGFLLARESERCGCPLRKSLWRQSRKEFFTI